MTNPKAPYQPDPALVRECAARIIEGQIEEIRDLGQMDIGEMCEDEIDALHESDMATHEAHDASDALIDAVRTDIKAAVISHAWPEPGVDTDQLTRERAEALIHPALHTLDVRIHALAIDECQCNLITQVALDAVFPAKAATDEAGPTFPTVTICGSMRFYPRMLKLAAELTTAGRIALMPHDASLTGIPDKTANEHGAMLDAMHRAKIRMSGSVHVVNTGGYIGESTRCEIEYATSLGIAVEYDEAPEASAPPVRRLGLDDGSIACCGVVSDQ
jgi:hypothetical protein